MTMTQTEAADLKAQIERAAPEVTAELREYAPGWVVEVKNPRTGETFGVVSPDDWRTRLLTMEGVPGSADHG